MHIQLNVQNVCPHSDFQRLSSLCRPDSGPHTSCLTPLTYEQALCDSGKHNLPFHRKNRGQTEMRGVKQKHSVHHGKLPQPRLIAAQFKEKLESPDPSLTICPIRTGRFKPNLKSREYQTAQDNPRGHVDLQSHNQVFLFMSTLC